MVSNLKITGKNSSQLKKVLFKRLKEMARSPIKTIALGLTCLMLCQTGFAFEQDALVVWINNDKGFNGLAKVAQRFTVDTGVKVIIETQDNWSEESGDPANRFTRSATTQAGPDIIFWAHDRFGSWINEGLLDPVQPSVELMNKIHDFAWDAVTVGESIYGYPIAMEAISLIYNKDIIQAAPQTWEEVITLDKKLRKQNKRAIQWMTDNAYFTWPLITSAGGYSFKKANKAYQLTDVGLDNKGSIKGLKLLNRLYREGVIKDEDANNWGGMMDGFKSGKVAMMINGPWTWKELDDAGVNYGLAKFPKVDNNSGHGRPFVGFLAGAVNSFSPNDALAKKFLEEYVVVYDGVKTINDDRSLGAVPNKQLMNELQSNDKILHTYTMAATGETMPDIPEMKRFWGTLQAKLQPMITGELAFEATLKDIAKRLRKLDKMKMWSRKHYLTSTDSLASSGN